jgi:hypothetical protein
MVMLVLLVEKLLSILTVVRLPMVAELFLAKILLKLIDQQLIWLDI